MPASALDARFQGFHDLIRHRVREILLVSTPYDAWVLEQDQSLSERLFSEYVALDLRYVPRITRVGSGVDAVEALRRRPFDLVLCMARLPDLPALAFRERAHAVARGCPIVFLTYDALDRTLHDALRADEGSDRIFYWMRDTAILTSIVKSVEDELNAPADTRAGVQVILLVEDSPRHHSLLLPLLYTQIVHQTRRLISGSANDFERLLRMRARPKILLADTLARARRLVDAFGPQLLALVSDVRFPTAGGDDAQAGFTLAAELRARFPDVPVVLHSSEPENRAHAAAQGFAFLDKDNPDLGAGLRDFLLQSCGFGDFVFRLPDGREVGRAATLHELRERIAALPEESLLYHAQRNHFSVWLRARSEFALAEDLRPMRITDFPDGSGVRRAIFGALERASRAARDGAVREFAGDRLRLGGFQKLGAGSLGGKGRGLAFISAQLARSDLSGRYPTLPIEVPDTWVLCSDLFERFLEENDLGHWALAAEDDAAIARRFRSARIPRDVAVDLRLLLEGLREPIAVRSSSLLEDNQILPFAGIYATFLLPNSHPDVETRLAQLTHAVKQVYASQFFRGPRGYLRNTGYRLDEERMSVLVQRVAGARHGTRHYPTLSGVARSRNDYAFGATRPEDGTAALALGLGQAIVGSQRAYHFCPAAPRANPPWATTDEYLANTQTRFWALDCTPRVRDVGLDPDAALVELDLGVAERDGELRHVASTWSAEDGRLSDYITAPGPRVVRFAQILKHGTLPLPELLRDLLALGRESFGAHVEVEFAVQVDPDDAERGCFHLLQVRPMPGEATPAGGQAEERDPETLVARSVQAMGNLRLDGLRDLVYLDPARFDFLRTREIAAEVEAINRGFVERGEHYVLLGFGRWGTSDPLLGVPVTFEQVSQARVVVEADRHDLWVEPSQGSHFFQNMLALRIGYLFIKETRRGDYVAWDWLQAQPAVARTRFVRHLRFAEPLAVEIDGRTSHGLIAKPPR